MNYAGPENNRAIVSKYYNYIIIKKYVPETNNCISAWNLSLPTDPTQLYLPVCFTLKFCIIILLNDLLNVLENKSSGCVPLKYHRGISLVIHVSSTALPGSTCNIFGNILSLAIALKKN